MLTKIETFVVLEYFDRFIQFLGMFYAQITPANLRDTWVYFDFKNDQPFSKKCHAPQFTWISLDAPIKIECDN